MRSRVARVVAATVLLVFAAPFEGSAQMAHRLKGSVRTEAGAPIANASIRADALSGFRGEQASASLLGRDWESAGKWLWDARDLAPKDQRQALAAAIDDLRGISRVQ